jgi:PilZ domain-containing protein
METQQVLTQVHVSWKGESARTAFLIHAAPNMLVLDAGDVDHGLPPEGMEVSVETPRETLIGRVAEHGRAGRFLVALGDRPVRRANRLPVSLPAIVRAAHPYTGELCEVEIVDLTTGGARVRGMELPVGADVNLCFTPPGREEPVTVRAGVVHATQGAQHPWMGLAFRLVALRGGRA